MRTSLRTALPALFAAYLLVHQGAAHAVPEAREPAQAAATQFGHAAPQAAADREIMLEKDTANHVHVKRFETIRLTLDGRTVTWTFDTRGTPSFSLAKVIPGASGTVHVEESPYYAY